MLSQGSKSLKYGLNKRPAPNSRKIKALPVFSNDDEDDVADGFVAGDGRGSVQAQLARQAQQRSSTSRIDSRYAEAIAQDPTVFSYDEVYDDLKGNKADEAKQEKTERKPRYVHLLKKSNELREREHEILYERKLAKERADEDDEFGDKDKFVTSSYKKKLAEMQKWEEEQRLRDEEIDRNNVAKKADLSDLYKNLFSKDGASVATPQDERENETAEAETPNGTMGQGRDEGTEEMAAQDDEPIPEKGSGSAGAVEETGMRENPPAKKSLKRVIDEEAVQSARERYLARKRAKKDKK